MPSSRRGVLVVGTVGVGLLGLGLTVIGGAVIALSTSSCPAEFSGECARRVGLAQAVSVALQAFALMGSIALVAARRLSFAQRALGICGIMIFQVAAVSLVRSWVTAAW